MTTPFKSLSLCLLMGALTSAAATQPSSAQPVLNPEAERLYKAVNDAVSAAGGDLNAQHVHLAFAFSTGHFARDPAMAEAARIIASDLAEAHLVAGDQLSAYAWELQLWPHEGERLNPFKVSPDRAALRASFQDLWPRTAQAGTEGGHDTEAAIAELAERLRGQADAVMILLTNTAASAAGQAGQRTIGENAPEYVSALTGWTRVQTSNTTGASLQLSVGTGAQTRRFDAVILTPREFQGEALGAPRSELVAAQIDPAPTDTGRSFPWWILGLLTAAVVGLALFLRRSRPAPRSRRPGAGQTRMSLHLAGRSFPLKDIKVGEPVCVLCGPGYPVPPSSTTHVVLGSGLPPIKLLTVSRLAGGLKVTPDLDVTVDSDAPPLIPIDRDTEYRLNLRGRAALQPNLPPKPYQAALTLALRPEEN